MNTMYYTSFQVTRRSDNAKLWYVTEMYITEAEARQKFEEKIKRHNVTEAHLFRADNYYKGEELPFPETSNRTPWGWRQTTLLASYEWGRVKNWNI